jgi:hypothetical protein
MAVVGVEPRRAAAGRLSEPQPDRDTAGPIGGFVARTAGTAV